jgi:hypothetical protein
MNATPRLFGAIEVPARSARLAATHSTLPPMISHTAQGHSLSLPAVTAMNAAIGKRITPAPSRRPDGIAVSSASGPEASVNIPPMVAQVVASKRRRLRTRKKEPELGM